MRDFPDGSMRPRDFSAFSLVESGKRPRVHATKARAYTRSRGTAARGGTRKGRVSEDREAEAEEDGSRPDTRFVRRVYPVSRK